MSLNRLLGALLVALCLYVTFSPLYPRLKSSLHGAGLSGSASGLLVLGTAALLIACGGWLMLRGGRSL